jgi:hypothetical protein
MKRKYLVLGLLVATQFASSGCALFRRDDCCGERRGLFGGLFHRKSNGNGMECGMPCNTCGTGEVQGTAMMGGPMMGGPMLAAPGVPPDERLGPPAANRPWEGPGAPPPAQMPKTK